MSEFDKNRVRSAPTFMNINLLGPCNADCYFCLGRDLAKKYFEHNQLSIHYSHWKNFEMAMYETQKAMIHRVYVTGQTTDSLAYQHIEGLVQYLKRLGTFTRVGLRTNGLLAVERMHTINLCDSVGYSIHTLKPEVNRKIMGVDYIPPWESILNDTKCPRIRVSIVVGRYNVEEVYSILDFLSGFPQLRYVQLRKTCTDNRSKELLLDAEIYESFHDKFAKRHIRTGSYEAAPVYSYRDMEVVFWRTVKTTTNSFNYFTDGTFSKEYFIVEGYANEHDLDPASREFTLTGIETSRSNAITLREANKNAA